MNTQNLEFLEKTLFYLGFGEKLNEQLEKNIKSELKDFTLEAQHEFNQKNIDYTLHFRAGDEADMYFFNKYEAKIDGNDHRQTFYINSGNGFTAKEAFNLLEGRSVHKIQLGDEGEKRPVWHVLDPNNLTESGNMKIKHMYENYGFDLEKVLSGTGIKEMETPDTKENLFRSLQKGNAQQITVSKDGKETKYFIAASPQFKTINLFDNQMRRLKREELITPGQHTAKDLKKTKQQKEGLPQKKQRSRKMSA